MTLIISCNVIINTYKADFGSTITATYLICSNGVLQYSNIYKIAEGSRSGYFQELSSTYYRAKYS